MAGQISLCSWSVLRSTAPVMTVSFTPCSSSGRRVRSVISGASSLSGAVEREQAFAVAIDAGMPTPSRDGGPSRRRSHVSWRIRRLPFAGDGEQRRREALAAEGEQPLHDRQEDEAIAQIAPLDFGQRLRRRRPARSRLCARVEMVGHPRRLRRCARFRRGWESGGGAISSFARARGGTVVRACERAVEIVPGGDAERRGLRRVLGSAPSDPERSRTALRHLGGRQRSTPPLSTQVCSDLATASPGAGAAHTMSAVSFHAMLSARAAGRISAMRSVRVLSGAAASWSRLAARPSAMITARSGTGGA